MMCGIQHPRPEADTMPRSSSRPTVATIARDLGISPATVSYALNDKPGVGAATRERVLAHAREVGWTPHSGAQALRRGRSGNVGIVLVRDPQEISREPFYSAVTAGIESSTSAHGYELLLRFVTGGTDEEINVFRTWAERRRVDGVVLLDLAVSDRRPAVLDSLGLDVAILGHYVGPEDFVQVATAEAADAATVVDHVVAQGYDACLQLSGPIVHAHEARRVQLVRELCAGHGIPHAHAVTRYTVDDAASAFTGMDHALSSRPAVIASSDLVALGAVRGAAALGLRVPEQLGVVSWDDSLVAEVSAPALTALDRRPFDMGHLAGDLLVQKIEGGITGGAVLHNDPAKLTLRASTAPA